MALLDVAVAATNHLSQNDLSTGRVATRAGTGSLLFAPSNGYPCSDGLLLIQIGNDGQWARLCKVLDLPDWLTDARFATNPLRMQQVQALDAEVQAMTRQRRRADLAEALGGVGVPCGPVNNLAQELGLSAQDLQRQRNDGAIG